MPDNVITDNSPASTATALQVLYAGCLDSDPYLCLKQCDRIVTAGLWGRGVEVRELQDELPKGRIFRKLNRALFYPALVAKATRDQRSEISTRHPPIVHIGSQCYANLIPIAQRLKPKACIPVSITVHDLAEHYFPQDLTPAQMRRWRKRIAHIKQADLIFSVSQHTKDDLVRLFEIPDEKIIVNTNGVDSAFRTLPDEELTKTLKALGARFQALGELSPDSFNILAVGANLYRKNLPTLIKAVKVLASRGVKITLIKVGDPIPQGLMPKASSLEGVNLGFVSSPDLVHLYNLCDVLSFPSLYEGFGMPVVEAQRCGLPCVVSNASSLPEIGGDGALYHDPLDEKGLADQLQRIYEDEALRTELREKGLLNAERFSWEKHIDTLLKGFRNISTTR